VRQPEYARARRAGYGATPPAPKDAPYRLRATARLAALNPGDHCGPWDQEKRQTEAAPTVQPGKL